LPTKINSANSNILDKLQHQLADQTLAGLHSPEDEIAKEDKSFQEELMGDDPRLELMSEEKTFIIGLQILLYLVYTPDNKIDSESLLIGLQVEEVYDYSTLKPQFPGSACGPESWSTEQGPVANCNYGKGILVPKGGTIGVGKAGKKRNKIRVMLHSEALLSPKA
ncbi:hypothetical protein STEG23_029315, partial [Scotinomys teguina]